MKQLLEIIQDLTDYIIRLECCTGDKIEPRPNVLNCIRIANEWEEKLHEKKD